MTKQMSALLPLSDLAQSLENVNEKSFHEKVRNLIYYILGS
jgi:hypothetical protein